MIREALEQTRLITILRGMEGIALERMLRALADGGVKLAEITLNSPNALQSIHVMRERFDKALYVGAGTVTNIQEIREADAAGAQFIVTPNLNEEVAYYCMERDILIIPGVLTPGEIAKAIQCGCEYIKLFPVGVWGPEYLKAVKAPFDKVKMIAVGGITLENASQYIQSGAYGLGIGGALSKTPADGNYEEIIRKTRELLRICAN